MDVYLFKQDSHNDMIDKGMCNITFKDAPIVTTTEEQVKKGKREREREREGGGGGGKRGFEKREKHT